MTTRITPQRIRRFIQFFVLFSFLFHFSILADIAAYRSTESPPVLWGYSSKKLALILVYGVFLIIHLTVLLVRRLEFFQSRLLFGLIVVSILYSGVEFLFRYHGFGLITPSKVKGLKYTWHKPNTRFTYIGQSIFTPHEYTTEVRNNSKGYNDREHDCIKEGAKLPYRIVLMGDSFVEAFQVNHKETLHSILEEKLTASWNRDVGVIAIGLSGTGLLWQTNNMFDELVECYQPDVILSQYASWFVQRDAAISHYLESKNLPPASRYNSSEVTSMKATDTTSDYKMSYQQLLYWNRYTQYFVEDNLSNSIGFILSRFARLLDTLRQEKRELEKSQGTQVVYKDHQVLRRSCEAYRRLQSELRSRNIDLKVVFYPVPGSIAYYRSDMQNVPTDVQYERMMEKCLKDADIPFVNLSRRFAEEIEVPERGFSYRFDGHWNTTGHAFGAKWVARDLFNVPD